MHAPPRIRGDGAECRPEASPKKRIHTYADDHMLDHRYHRFADNGIAIDARRHHLVAIDMDGLPRCFSLADGSLVVKKSFFLNASVPRAQIRASSSSSLVVDEANDRIIVSSTKAHEFYVWSLSDGTYTRVQMHNTDGVWVSQDSCFWTMVFDKKRRRLIVAGGMSEGQLFVYSTETWSLVSVETIVTPTTVAFRCAVRCLAIDKALDRMLVTFWHADEHLQVYSLEDFSPLFRFSIYNGLPKPKYSLGAICVVNRGRVVCADEYEYRLLAFDAHGRPLDAFSLKKLKDIPRSIVFDAHAGLIVVNTTSGTYVIDSNVWLPGTFEWTPERHVVAPRDIRRAAETLTMIRSLEPGCVVSLLPNELLFEIFERLV